MVLEQEETEEVLRQLEASRVEQLADIDKNIAETDEQIKLVLETEKDLEVSRYSGKYAIYIKCQFRSAWRRKSKKFPRWKRKKTDSPAKLRKFGKRQTNYALKSKRKAKIKIKK